MFDFDLIDRMWTKSDDGNEKWVERVIYKHTNIKGNKSFIN